MSREHGKTQSSAIIDRARKIILTHGSNSTAYQIINPGFRRWFSAGEEGLVGYVRQGKMRVAAGEPICDAKLSVKIADRFERETQAKGIKRICWFCATADFAQHFHKRPGYSTILIGAQPTWHPDQWQTKVLAHSSLRAQLNRARNKGVIVREWPNAQAAGHPELERCLREWLDARPFPPLHFLVEPQTLHRLFDRRVFVAEQQGKAIGFVLLSPVVRRNGWLVEQFVRSTDAPNGTIELALDYAMRIVADEGYSYVTLGLAPLSKRAGIIEANPSFIQFLFDWLQLHGRRFYNFDGLDFFKAKFSPDAWEPIWAISNEPRFSFRTLYGVAAAFSDGSPMRAISIGMLKALRQEGAWFIGRLRSRKD